MTIPGLTTNCGTVLSGGLALYETRICVSNPISVSTAGSFSNTAYATGDSATSPNSLTSYATSGLALVKSVTESNFYGVGDVLHYSFLVTNDGFAPLAGPVVVSDDKSTDESCPAVNTVGDFDNYLDPGESITCASTYTIQAADLAAMSVTNIASAAADNVASNTDTLTVDRALLDFGDLPSAYHNTLLSADGARHTIGSLYLGATVGSKDDGQESAAASADPNDDGVVPVGNWSDGSGEIDVTVSGGRGCLMGWFDSIDKASQKILIPR